MPMKNIPTAVALDRSGVRVRMMLVAVGTSVASPAATKGRTASRVRKLVVRLAKAVNRLQVIRPPVSTLTRPIRSARRPAPRAVKA